MIVTVAIILTLVPALLILWPFVMGLRRDEFEYDEGAPQADLMRRWDAAVAGLTSTELDHSLGNLSDEDYQGLRTRLLTEAADLMREMELSEEEEERMLAALSEEVQGVRTRIQGDSDDENAMRKGRRTSLRWLPLRYGLPDQVHNLPQRFQL